MRHHGGTSTGATTASGIGIRGVSLHASVFELNHAAAHTHADFLLLLHDDVEVVTEGFLTTLLALAQERDVGIHIIKTVAEGEGSRILSHPEQVEGTLANKLLTNIGILYELTQAVSLIPDVGDLLDRVMELTFRALEADRGCIMIKNADSGQFQAAPEGVTR